MAVVNVLSRHPDAMEATAEVVGQVLEYRASALAGSARVGIADADYDLMVLFTTAEHRDAFAEIAGTIHQLLQPKRLLGTTAVGVLGGAQEVEDGPAVSLLATTLRRSAEPVRLTAASTESGTALQGLPHPADPNSHTLLLLADPFSFPVPDLLEVLAAREEPLRVMGGLASAGMAPAGNRFVLDDEVFDDGAVGAVLSDDDVIPAELVVSQGCRPIGSPMIVTQAQGAQVLELAGQPALSRLEQVANQATPDERHLLATQGVHLGVVADERLHEFRRGDFLVRNVLGADKETGALSVGAMVDVGTTVQFHVRDAASADEDLRELLAGRHAEGALVFTCNGRGQNLFGIPHHDARLVADITASDAVAGMFCAGEMGPIGQRSFLHGFTACVLPFR